MSAPSGRALRNGDYDEKYRQKDRGDRRRRIRLHGGGASGCMAAVAAARAGCSVTIFEKNEKICKKIYATGNGRCNLTNLFLDRTCYHTRNGKGEAVLSFIHDFSQEDLIRFFKEQGVPVHDRDGIPHPL